MFTLQYSLKIVGIHTLGQKSNKIMNYTWAVYGAWQSKAVGKKAIINHWRRKKRFEAKFCLPTPSFNLEVLHKKKLRKYVSRFKKLQ